MLIPQFRRYLPAILIVFVAFGWNWHVGHRGLFLYDSSIVFDGGWRIVQGQVPYKDFFMAHAPGAYFYLGLVFAIFGVSFSSMVFAACLLNVGAALMGYRIARKIAPDFGLIAGLLTAFWFQPMTGFLQVEQCAFFFCFVALWLIVEWERSGDWKALLSRGIAGAALAFAIVCKQNAGGFFVPVALGALVAMPFPRWKHRIGAVAAVGVGATVAFGCFALWLFQVSDPGLFWHHTVEIPRRFGGSRIFTVDFRQAMDHIGEFDAWPLTARWVGRLSLLIGVGTMAYELWIRRRFSLAAAFGWLLATSAVYQTFFILSALNEPQNGVPFLGVQFALIAGITLYLAADFELVSLEQKPKHPPLVRLRFRHWIWKLVVWVLGVAIAVEGGFVSYFRYVNQFDRHTLFERPIGVPGMERVHWGEPSFADAGKSVVVKQEDFESLARFLEKKDENFFVFPVSTILYGSLGKPSVQPWLFYLQGHSFAVEDMPRMDRMTLESLKRHDVRTFVWEKASWLGEYTEMPKMAATFAWLKEKFRPTHRFGIYEVWERVEPGKAGGGAPPP